MTKKTLLKAMVSLLAVVILGYFTGCRNLNDIASKLDSATNVTSPSVTEWTVDAEAGADAVMTIYSNSPLQSGYLTITPKDSNSGSKLYIAGSYVINSDNDVQITNLVAAKDKNGKDFTGEYDKNTVYKNTAGVVKLPIVSGGSEKATFNMHSATAK